MRARVSQWQWHHLYFYFYSSSRLPACRPSSFAPTTRWGPPYQGPRRLFTVAASALWCAPLAALTAAAAGFSLKTPRQKPSPSKNFFSRPLFKVPHLLLLRFFSSSSFHLSHHLFLQGIHLHRKHSSQCLPSTPSTLSPPLTRTYVLPSTTTPPCAPPKLDRPCVLTNHCRCSRSPSSSLIPRSLPS